MNRVFGILLLLFFSGILLLSGQQQNSSSAYVTFYKAAENYYNTNHPTDATDSLALLNYQKVISQLNKQKRFDTILVDCYTKTGILYQAKNNDALAIKNFLKATSLKGTASLSDSLFFKPILFTGASFYSLNNYDSALYFFKTAEQIANKFEHLPEVERLYNKIGALYYQTGNYRQSINYFNKSIILLNPTAAGYLDFLVQYKTNLGAAYFKLKEYEKAMDIYESLLPLKTASRPSVLHNIGSIYLEKGNYTKALQYLMPLQYNLQFKLTDFARIYINLKKTDSAKFYLDSAVAENKKTNGNRKNITQGLTLKYYGDFELGQNDVRKAVIFYQQSIIQLDPDFFNEDVVVNPDQFNGMHSSFNLFAALVAKAEAFKLLYEKERDIKNLAAALDAYKAAFNLSQYVERFLDTDEARLFLKENVEQAYSSAVETAIKAYELTGKKEYQQQAFIFSETSKASILQVNRQQLQIEQIPDIPQELMHEERNIKANIAKLTLQAAAFSDSAMQAQKQQQISNFEIKLSKIQEKLNENPKYNKLRYNVEPMSVKQIQDDFIGTNTVLLSYYFTKQSLVTFVVTSNNFISYKQSVESLLISEIITARTAVESNGNYDKTTATKTLHQLFNQLIKPIYAAIKEKKHLIIIPHNQLQTIPFEMLENPTTENLLLKDFAISYNYAASFLTKKEKGNGGQQILAFAPFTTVQPYVNGSAGDNFKPLVASKAEVASLKGKILIDTAATKSNFMLYAQQFGIIHLATHANANDSNPAASFIAFYPGKNALASQSRLYEPEIYNLDLSRSSLVILSACETGKGRLVSGEGVMSLSRAFSYAGCPSVITSLWKAEDNATAFIMRQLHKYLQQGLDKDEALQKAKLAYLESDQIEARVKTPVFWASLILVGDPSAVYSKPQLIYWLIAGTLFLVVIFLIYRKIKNKNQ